MVTIFRRKLGGLGVSVVLVVAVGLLAAAVFFTLSALGVGQYTATAYITFVEPKSIRATVGDLSREAFCEAAGGWAIYDRRGCSSPSGATCCSSERGR